MRGKQVFNENKYNHAALWNLVLYEGGACLSNFKYHTKIQSHVLAYIEGKVMKVICVILGHVYRLSL